MPKIYWIKFWIWFSLGFGLGFGSRPKTQRFDSKLFQTQLNSTYSPFKSAARTESARRQQPAPLLLPELTAHAAPALPRRHHQPLPAHSPTPPRRRRLPHPRQKVRALQEHVRPPPPALPRAQVVGLGQLRERLVGGVRVLARPLAHHGKHLINGSKD